MYYGSEEFNSIVDTPNGQALKLRLTFSDDKKIELVKSLRFYGGSNASNDVAIGTTLSAYVNVSLFEDSNLTNQEFLLEVGATLEDETMEYAPIGYFTVQRPDSEDDTATFTAYDRMKRFDKPYVSSLEYPTTSDKVLEELCAICGVELATTIENPITITDNLQGYICREVLGYIAGIQGCFACIDRFGKLNVRWYENEPITKELKLVYSMDKAQDDYVVEKVEIHKDVETSFTSGTGTRAIYQSNPYATQEITNSIFAGIGGFSYRPCEVRMLDDIRIDPWDVLKITHLDGNEYLIPCMQIEHNFDKGLTRIEAVGATETENEYRYEGPIIQYLNRMAAELLTVNKIVANVVTTDYLEANYVSTKNLEAIQADIAKAVIEDLSAEFADIHLANIDIADIGQFFADSGVVTNMQIVDGKVTGVLDSVEINANSITSGTLTTDRLVIRGAEKSIVYELNNISGALQAVDVDTLNGEIITPRTINADRIIAESITANEIAAGTITANELKIAEIFANSTVTNTLFAQEITATGSITGAKLIGANAEIERGSIGKISIDGNGILTATYENETLVDEYSLLDNYININYLYWAPSVNDYKIVSGNTTLGFADLVFDRTNGYTDPHIVDETTGLYAESDHVNTRYSATGIVYNKTYDGYTSAGEKNFEISGGIEFSDYYYVDGTIRKYATKCIMDFQEVDIINLNVGYKITSNNINTDYMNIYETLSVQARSSFSGDISVYDSDICLYKTGVGQIASLNDVNTNLTNTGQWKALTLSNSWTGNLKARVDKYHKQVFISGYVYASSSVTNFSFCDLTGINALPTPLANTLQNGVACYKTGSVACLVYAYSNRYLTLAGNTGVPTYVNIDFSYRYE